MAQPGPYRSTLLSLYKDIMSLHRRKLPEQLRSVGDDYVRAEFKSMKKVKKSAYVEEYALEYQTFSAMTGFRVDSREKIGITITNLLTCSFHQDS